MSTTLRDAPLAARLAEVTANLLPAKPHPYGDAALSFPAAAAAVGLGAFWPGSGSKRTALTQLYTRTLCDARARFCPLALQIVQRAIAYGTGATREPLTRDDVDAINAVLKELGFGIPELRDPVFLASLPRRETSPSPGHQAGEVPTEGGGSGSGPTVAGRAAEPRALTEAVRGDLLVEFQHVAALTPQPRGLAFERFLTGLFDHSGLAPRGAFMLRGEQIDGSLQFEGATYLVEAKWTDDRIAQSPLLVLSGKVDSKAGWTRGLFISFAGFTDIGLEAFARGRATNLVCMDGLDLYHVLAGKLVLADVLRAKTRVAAETGRAFVPVRELFTSVI